MKDVLKVSLLLITVLILSACNKEETTNNVSPVTVNTGYTIMPLGASRVEGARPLYESFRYELWKKLIENNKSFDYIGTQTDDASYPMFNNMNFDTDHEGRGGWTSGEIIANLNDWLNQNSQADIVIYSSPAGNDALNNLPYNDAINNINAIIDLLQASNPNVTIIIEQMAPAHSSTMTTELTNYMNQLHQEMPNIANNKTTANSQVVTIDMSIGFTDAMLADDVHYNESGAVFIANKYYNLIAPMLN